MQTRVSFDFDGLALAGIVHVPDDLAPGERRPAFLVMHGFGTSKDGSTPEILVDMLADWGYVALRFDYRSCGESEGERGHILCLDQVADTSNAVTYMAGRDDVDAARIAVIGHSFGAAVAVYAGGVDPRIAAVISSCGWGDGARKFRGQHPGPAWERFEKLLADGKRHKAENGESLMASRWDIVPIPEHLRGFMPAGAIMEFPVETAQSMYDFVADDVVGAVAPRPLLLFHAADDSVTPTEQSLELFKRAGQPTDLVLLSDVDHFPFSVDSARTRNTVRAWLDAYFPVAA